MRSGLVIAVVAAVIIVIGAAFWYNNQAGTGLLEERPEDVLEPGADAPEARDAEMEEEAPVVVAPEIQGASPVSEPPSAVEEVAPPIARPEPESEPEPVSEPGSEDVAEDEPMVVGDPITEDTIVVDSATDDAVVLEPTEEPTVDFVEDGETTVTDAPATAAPASEGTATDAPAGTDAPAATGDGETLLTPEAFDAQQVRTLIAESTTLSDTERSTLTALVDGAATNPDMVDPAIAALREALDLPPLE